MAQVLVVDDDSWARLALRAILEGEGHEVTEAADGHAAEAVDAEAPADLIFLDMHMPRRDGIETLRALRKRGRAVKIVMVGGGCAMCRGDFLPMAQRLGADATLTKPLDGGQVQQLVAELLTRSA